ncbi:hypothetical protein MtrunA17_Chr2g0306731 [Medicago truncatula]|uniref:Uncharacterized protein n=1 Tax=Medicago truncatula TaxID=3880 RepID=A0A396J7C7_MEDTR|nr:hypothetical protein MtrunA17_Chr2g0306731 [Medicago truncatula]
MRNTFTNVVDTLKNIRIHTLIIASTNEIFLTPKKCCNENKDKIIMLK